MSSDIVSEFRTEVLGASDGHPYIKYHTDTDLIQRLAAEVERLREALAPFAAVEELMPASWWDNWQISDDEFGITAGHVRRAAALLGEAPAEP